MQISFHPGQRWISDSEPELGLGSVLRLSAQTVTIVFPASGETRQYARDNAPLRRVRFRAGDTIHSHEDEALQVLAVTERNGLLHYRHGQGELCETLLSDAISFNKPEDRLLAGQLDPTEVFDLRLAALQHQHQRRRSPVRGFVGGRIDLIPHQLHIAAEVSGRLQPRVLLADEVGLGKTIEACLVLHRLILTGRAQRVLILVPDSLVHQWFVELLRRFNLWFHIFDEERCAAIQASDPEANPFLDDQLVLASRRLFTGSETRLQQALAAGWDMLVVDEAHHLGWSPESVSRDYAVVEALGRKSAGLLLLTATPEQLGMASHFARLRLLDPARFHDLNEFVREAEGYRGIARLADKLLSAQALSAEEMTALQRILGKSATGSGGAADSPLTPAGRSALLADLLDRHGTGRVMFRNTRSTITGFPRRVAHLHVLPAPANQPDLLDLLAEEFTADTDAGAVEFFDPDFDKDPRTDWLADLLRRLGEDKVLLICRTQGKVEELDGALRRRLNVKMAAFHEGLTLVQRDRQAAWFSEADGARLLICSEIGSEGRNFQFAHHLVLFDLPLDPELLEQRIGRLDRIGQTSEIQVHVPFVEGSPQEVLARWFHEGLNSFQRNLHGGRELLEQFGRQVHDLALEFPEATATQRKLLACLITETVAARQSLTERLEQGRDRLLELNSFRPESAAQLVRQIAGRDADPELEDFMIEVFDHYGIHVEELSNRAYQLGSAGVFAESFPGLPAEGMTVTCDRQRALSREDVQFLTWDHPLVTGALDLLLGSEKGNSCFVKWPDPKTPGLYVEAVYVLECIAPPPLHVDRFLPPTPLRVVVDHRGADVGAALPAGSLAKLKDSPHPPLLDQAEFREDLLPELLGKTSLLAGQKVPGLIAQARKEAAAQLGHEIGRLQELAKVNRSVRPEEIGLLTRQKAALDQHLAAARLRLDAIRVIQRGPG